MSAWASDTPGWRTRLAVPLTLAAAGGVTGVALHVNPLIGIGLGGGLLALAAALVSPRNLRGFFLAVLAFALLGYAFLHRSFAYLGIAPLFISEVVLGLGLVAAAAHRDRWRSLRSPIAWLILLWIAWGTFRTVPYVERYGLLALRDGVLWGYGVFAFLIPVVLRRPGLERLPRWVTNCLPWFLMWAPLSLLSTSLFGRDLGGLLPTMPGTDIRLLEVKAGDMGTHLGGAAAFLLLGLHRLRGPSGKRPTGGWIRALPSDWLLWVLWGAGFVVAASSNRGGMLAALFAVAVVMALAPATVGRSVLRVAAPIMGLVLALLVFDIAYEREGKRSYSPRQIGLNLVSVVGEGSREAGISTTREWRLMWWEEIVGYTFKGPYFWTGKGFGINLADDDGFQVTAESALRSPHNGHMTVLARAGVPGIVIWGLIHAAFAVVLLAAFRRARRRRLEWWAALYAWILAYWAAFVVNASFDVFLEGPPGGIWFWCIMGTGIAAVLAFPNERDADRRMARTTIRPALPRTAWPGP